MICTRDPTLNWRFKQLNELMNHNIDNTTIPKYNSLKHKSYNHKYEIISLQMNDIEFQYIIVHSFSLSLCTQLIISNGSTI